MQLKDRFLLVVAAIAIAISLFAGVVVIVDNVSLVPIRHGEANPPIVIAIEYVSMLVPNDVALDALG